MTYKSILTVFDGSAEAQAAVDTAAALARENDGHLDILCLAIDRLPPAIYYGHASTALMSQSLANARAEADSLEVMISAHLKTAEVPWTCRAGVSQISLLYDVVGGLARFADLVVLPKPYGRENADEAAAVLEAALFEGHAPVLVCPGPVTAFGSRIVAAWNESAEAMTAIRAALPMLIQADRVDVAVVDPGRHGVDDSDPGQALCQMLSRHGARVDVTVLARTLPTVADVLCRHCRDTGAELLVMGAYGHSRFRESILGGATRDMLEQAEVPVLMAH